MELRDIKLLSDVYTTGLESPIGDE